MRARFVFALVTVAAGAAAGAACLLADPPPLQPIPHATAPVILRTGLSPSTYQKITSAPAQALTFSVPVQINFDQQLRWRVFVDLDPNGDPTRGSSVVSGGADGGVLATTPDASTVVVVPVVFTLSSQLDFGSCHRITIVVGEDFQTGLPASPIEPPGGDSVTWFYEPVTDCSYFDAAPPLDASAVDDDGADE